MLVCMVQALAMDRMSLPSSSFSEYKALLGTHPGPLVPQVYLSRYLGCLEPWG